nr:DUF2892 domain-containing protein [Lysinibacillus timonensis]
MQENISERNGFVRLMCGVAMTAMGTAHLTRDSKALGFTLITAGAMKVAEGIFLYCPLTAAINSNVKNAVSSTFDEYMDGETLMQAFNANYSGNGGQSNSSGSSNGGGISQAASQVAGAVANAASQSEVGKAVSQAAQTVANTMGGNSSQNGSKNKNSNSGSGQSKNNNGQSATNPS